MSTAYHPEIDGQTEVVNRTLQQYLRAFVQDKLATWKTLLPWAEWCYNSSVHSSTGISPFEVIYGRAPPAVPDYLPQASPVEAVDTPPSAPSPLPVAVFQNCPVLTPAAILDSKLDTSSEPPTSMVLIQWQGLAPEDATWIPRDQLDSTTILEDKDSLVGGANDTSVAVQPISPRPKRTLTRPRHLADYV